MSAGSFIEMFMTVFGWQLYNIVWDVMSSTGLAYIPILAAIIDNVVKPMESQESKSAASVSLRRLEVDLIRIVVVIAVCIQPTFTINFSSLSHFNACENRTVTASEGVAKDIYGNMSIANTAAKAPAWFYLVMTVSGAINDYVVTSLPCSLDVRELNYQTSLVKITDSHLKTQVKDFVNECYEPAKTDFFENQTELPSSVDSEDLTWAGSKYFRSTYYQNHYAKNPVVNFPFDPSSQGDMPYYIEGKPSPEWGYPSCETWWSKGDVGLEDRLQSEFPQDTWDSLVNYVKGDTQKAEDIVVKNALSNISTISSPRSTQQSDSNDVGGFVNSAIEMAGGFGAYVGGLIAEAVLQPTLYFTIKMAPYIQATMLMSIYFLLPWIFLVGNYEFSVIKTGTVTIFAIKFWTSIWAVISLLDNNLSEAIKSYYGISGITVIGETSTFITVIVDLLILSLYIGLPMFFLSMLSWGGEKGAAQANGATGSVSGGAKTAGDAGASKISGGLG